MRLIDADAFVKKHTELADYFHAIGNERLAGFHCKLAAIIGNEFVVPTVDAEPVRHGRWIPNGAGGWHCSECHATDDYAYFKTYGGLTGEQQDLYCPNCGARMDLEVQSHG